MSFQTGSLVFSDHISIRRMIYASLESFQKCYRLLHSILWAILSISAKNTKNFPVATQVSFSVLLSFVKFLQSLEPFSSLFHTQFDIIKAGYGRARSETSKIKILSSQHCPSKGWLQHNCWPSRTYFSKACKYFQNWAKAGKKINWARAV